MHKPLGNWLLPPSPGLPSSVLHLEPFWEEEKEPLIAGRWPGILLWKRNDFTDHQHQTRSPWLWWVETALQLCPNHRSDQTVPILANMSDRWASSSVTVVAFLPCFLDNIKIPNYRHNILSVSSKSPTLVALKRGYYTGRNTKGWRSRGTSENSACCGKSLNLHFNEPTPAVPPMIQAGGRGRPIRRQCNGVETLSYGSKSSIWDLGQVT